MLFAALAIFGPDRQPITIAILCALGVFQVVEHAILVSSMKASVASFVIKLALCYLLIGWTDGISSSYYWVLLLPVVSASTTLGLAGTIAGSAAAIGAYLSFLARLRPDQYIPPDQVRELFFRIIILPVVAYLTHELAEVNRTQARKYQTTAEQLADANRHLQEAEAAVRRSDRLAALGQLSAGLAHELRNPLGTIKASAEMLTKSVGTENDLALEMANFISSEVDRTNSLVTRFLDFARPLALRPEKTDLSQVLDRAVEQVERHQPPFDVSIYKNYSPDVPPFYFDGELIERVVYNLVLNAVHASPPQGTVTVKTRQINGTAEIAVIDRGSGIEPKHLESIFNPFFTTKSSGVGLGLAIVSKIVDEHGGKISVESEPGHGSVFRVYLPERQSS